MSYKCISIEEAKLLIDGSDVTLADVRDAGSHQAGNIANSIHLSDDTVQDFLSTAAKDKPLVLYCYHGNSSQGAADYFASNGFIEVYSIDGGYEAWKLKY